MCEVINCRTGPATKKLPLKKSSTEKSNITNTKKRNKQNHFLIFAVVIDAMGEQLNIFWQY